MKTRLPFNMFAMASIGALVLFSADINTDRLQVEHLLTPAVSVLDETQDAISIRTGTAVSGNLTIAGDVEFPQGIPVVPFIEPGIPMGRFTNTQVVAQNAPTWWNGYGVLTANAPNDLAALTQGQLKWIASRAMAMFNDTFALDGGAGSAISNLVASFTLENNDLPVTIGQLKHVSEVFWNRLMELGVDEFLPWSGSHNDFALATIGQAKHLFAFDMLNQDWDNDGIADRLEYLHGLNPFNGLDASSPSPEPYVPWLAYARSNEFMRVHVDCEYAGAVSDGSPQYPWKNLKNAVLSIPATQPALVLVAPGIYSGHDNAGIIVDRPDLVVAGAGERGSVVFKIEFMGWGVQQDETVLVLGESCDRSTIIMNITFQCGPAPAVTVDSQQGGVVRDCVFRGYQESYNWSSDYDPYQLDAQLALSGAGIYVINCVFSTTYYELAKAVSHQSGIGERSRILNCFFDFSNPYTWPAVSTSTQPGCFMYESWLSVEHCTFSMRSGTSARPAMVVEGAYAELSASLFLNGFTPVETSDAGYCSTWYNTVDNSGSLCFTSGRTNPGAFAPFIWPGDITFDIDGFGRGTLNGYTHPGCSEYGAAAMALDDSDGDGLPDTWEQQNIGSLAYGDADDLDHDGIANGLAFRLGLAMTPPARGWDRDGDGIPDAVEAGFDFLDMYNELDASAPSPEPYVPWLCYVQSNVFQRVYVDCTYDGVSDGTQAHPWPTIRAALSGIPSSQPALVLVAPGLYTGSGNTNIELNRPDLVISGAGPRGSVVFQSDTSTFFTFRSQCRLSTLLVNLRFFRKTSNVDTFDYFQAIKYFSQNGGFVRDCLFHDDIPHDYIPKGPVIFASGRNMRLVGCAFVPESYYPIMHYYGGHEEQQTRMINCFASTGSSAVWIEEVYGYWHEPEYSDYAPEWLMSRGDIHTPAKSKLSFEQCTFIGQSGWSCALDGNMCHVDVVNSLFQNFYDIIYPYGTPGYYHITHSILANGMAFTSGRSKPNDRLLVPVLHDIPCDMDGLSRGATNNGFTFAGCSEYRYQDDSDEDGLPDWWEMEQFGGLWLSDGSRLDENSLSCGLTFRLGLNFFNSSFGDTDLDGVPDIVEIAAGTNPYLRDSDGDGLVDGSDPDPLTPTPLLDTDGDGIPDAYEIWRFGNINARGSLNEDITTNGFPLATEIAAGLDPNQPASSPVSLGRTLSALELAPAFGAAFDTADKLVFERTITIDRDGGWQQYFLSGSTNAAAWSLGGMVLEWCDSGNESGSATASPPGDSLWLPVSTNSPKSLTLRLYSTSQVVCNPQPLYLLTWAPGVQIDSDNANCIKAVTNNVEYIVLNLNVADTLSAGFDRSTRPCLAAPCELERAGTSNPFVKADGLKFTPRFALNGVATGGVFKVAFPGRFSVPSAGGGTPPQQASAGFALMSTRGGGNTQDNTAPDSLEILGIDPVLEYVGSCSGEGRGLVYANGQYSKTSHYPLDSECLWDDWHRGSTGEWVCDCEPEVNFGAGGLSSCFAAVIWEPEENHALATVSIGGAGVWNGEAWHEKYEPDESTLSSDDCGGCSSGCEDGNCDEFEGPDLGSLAFRIPLGFPRQNQIDGFLWFKTETPVPITRSLFEFLPRKTNSTVAIFHVVGTIAQATSRGERGRDVFLNDIPGGVRITITNLFEGKLAHTWEITNPGGNAGTTRFRKISRQNNVMSDETFIYNNGQWNRQDNISRLSENIIHSGDLNDPENDTLTEERIIRDLDGLVLSRTMTESRRFGKGVNAVLRETCHREQTFVATETGDDEDMNISCASYWEDDDFPLRNGRPRLVYGNDRAWYYQAWNHRGHALLRLDQWNGSTCPVEALDHGTPLTLATLPAGITCTVTVMDYTPLFKDSNHPDDIGIPRTITRWLVRNNTQTMISRQWHVYTHATNDFRPILTTTTIRACSQTAQVDDPGNAVSVDTSFEVDAQGIPLLLRGRTLSSTGEDGVTTVYAYDFGTFNHATHTFTPGAGAPHLRTMSMRTTVAAPNGIPGKSTKDLVIQDAAHGVAVHTATLLADNDTPLEWQTHTFDTQNRLIHTQYSDGSSSTNAYSCCRLLHTIDRDGAKTVRSATTGQDHLYYAMEQISIRELVEADRPNADPAARYIPVTQHFMDALGRETKTVTRVASTNGVAVNPNFVNKFISHALTNATEYPFGTSDYSIHTDRSGLVTVSYSCEYWNGTEHVTETYIPGNPNVLIAISQNVSYRNGDSDSYHTYGQWTFDSFCSDYTPDGCRRTTSITESSDYGVITNSITLYDFLGRLLYTDTHLGRTDYLYEDASTRVLQTAHTGSPDVFHLYDVLGDSIGILSDGIADVSDVLHETLGNELWQITTQYRVIGSITNTLSSSRTQLTGLSNALRSHSVSIAANGSTITTTSSFNPTTKVTTTTSATDDATPFIQKSKYGLVIETRSLTERVETYYDAFLMPWRYRRFNSANNTQIERIDVVSFDPRTWAPVQTEHRIGSLDLFTRKRFYNIFGLEGRRIDPLGNTVDTGCDALGRTVSVYGDTYPVDYGYDSAGRMTSLATHYGENNTPAQTRWSYDPATGLNTRKTYADNSFVGYSHTPNGQPLRTTWARGEWHENTYNNSNLLVARNYSDATPPVAYTYDPAQYLIAASNSIAHYAYANTRLGVATNETATISGNTFTLNRNLDSLQRLSELRINGNHSVTYLYDTENRISVASNAHFVVTYDYSSDGYDMGHLITTSSGVQLRRTLTRDAYRRGLITSISNSVAQASLPLDFQLQTLAYDLLNRLTRRNTDTFGYNPRSELTSATIATTPYTYTYDAIGNALHTTRDTAATAYTPNALNQYTDLSTSSAPPRELDYDADGNLLSDGTFTYTWDAENRLTQISTFLNPQIPKSSHAYDHQHRRVQKTTPSAIHTYFYDNWNLVLETIDYPNGSSEAIEYVWGKDLSDSFQGAGGVGGLLAVRKNNTWYFPCYDHNGNITDYLSASGTTVAHYEYDAFGNTITQSGSLADSFSYRFSTKYLDLETNFYYYGYRFYSPTLGRWLNRDPLEEHGGKNLYYFCRNNAIDNLDFLGLSSPAINNFFDTKEHRENENANINMFDFIEIRAKCIGRDGATEATKIDGTQIKIQCDKSKLIIYSVPRFTPPKEIHIASTHSSSSGVIGGIPQIYTPSGKDIHPDAWGEPTNTKISKRSLVKDIQYTYGNAKFTAGRFIYAKQFQLNGKLSDWTLISSSTDMYKTWSTHIQKLPMDEIQYVIYDVSCDEEFYIQVGSKGKSPKIGRIRIIK